MADFMGMMKQAAQLQSKMQALQAELDQMEIEGTAGGGMVTVTLTGKGDLKGVRVGVPVHRQPAFHAAELTLPETERACAEVLCLPLHGGISRADVDLVCDLLRAG